MFTWKWINVDVLGSLGQPADDWHRIVSRWLPIPNDLFAVIMLALGVAGLFFTYALEEEKSRS